MNTLSNKDSQVNGNHLVSERRKFIRLNINVEIKYAVLAQAGQHTAKTKDIGGGGICLLVDRPLNTGDILKMEIMLPGDPPIVHAIGKVVWTKSFSLGDEKQSRYDVGIEFTEISEKERTRINKYVFSIRTPR